MNTGEAGFSVPQYILFLACLQGSSAAPGAKRAKLESWERSVGTLGGRGALGSLVVRKKAATTDNKPVVNSTSTTSTSKTGNKWPIFILININWFLLCLVIVF